MSGDESRTPGRIATYTPAIFIWAIVAFASFMKTGPGVMRGTLPGNDDYMRLVQIRDWLGGQAWGDPVQSRMFPADALISHWGRFSDVIVGGFIKILTPFLGPAQAETAALIIIPVALLLMTLLLIVKLAVTISDKPWVALAAALTGGLCFPVFYQFYPGRIDHHGLQIVLALGTALAIIGSTKRANLALIAGSLCGLSFWVGIESAPYIAAACAAISINWALGRSAIAGRALMLFGLSFAAITALCLLISPAQSRLTAACDAISPVFALLSAAIAAAMIIAALIGSRLKTPLPRLILISALGLLAAGVTIAIYPQCLSGPYAQLNPRLTEVWLSNVSEAKPFHKTFADNVTVSLAMIMVPALAVLGLFFGYPRAGVFAKIFGHNGVRTLLIFVIFTAMTGLIQTRMFSFSGALGAPLAAVLIARLAGGADRFKSDLSRALARVSILLVLCPLFIPAVLGMALPKSQINETDAKPEAPKTAQTQLIRCNEPAALRALNAYPAGFAITQIDLGAPMLAATHHSVSSAPYHRNEKGLMAAIDIFLSDEPAARKAILALNPQYVIACTDLSETKLFTKTVPDSLLTDLTRGQIPDWLRPVTLSPLPGGQENPVLAYRVITPLSE